MLHLVKSPSLSFGYLILAVSIFTACQKPNDPTLPPDPTNPNDTLIGKVDSILLIKDYIITSYDMSGVEQDVFMESFSYDTINRQIVLTHHAIIPGYALFPDGLQVIFSYNSFNKLTEVSYKFPAGFPEPSLADYWITSIKFSYDNQQIVSNLAYKRSNGVMIDHVFKKTVLAGGNYELEWEDPSSLDSSYNLYRKIINRRLFDATGKCMSKTHIEYLPNFPNNSKYIEIDSLIYDGDGQLMKVEARVADSLGVILKTFTPIEVNSRGTKGDQISNQVNLLFNGVINMIGYDDATSYPEFGGALTSLMAGDYYTLLNRYPALTSKIYAYPASGPVGNQKSYFDNIIVSKIDILGRLTNYSVAAPGSDVSKFSLEVSYYK